MQAQITYESGETGVIERNLVVQEVCLMDWALLRSSSPSTAPWPA